jgi:hypothetical protein
MRAGALALVVASCAQVEPAPAGRLIDTGIVFAAEQTAAARPDGRALPGPYWAPGDAEIAAAEARIATTFASMSNERAYRISTNLPTYKRQYLGYTIDGRRFIYANAFCVDHWQRDPAWPARLVEVDDGGACYFSLHYDIEGDRIDRLSINGEA